MLAVVVGAATMCMMFPFAIPTRGVMVVMIAVAVMPLLLMRLPVPMAMLPVLSIAVVSVVMTIAIMRVGTMMAVLTMLPVVISPRSTITKVSMMPVRRSMVIIAQLVLQLLASHVQGPVELLGCLVHAGRVQVLDRLAEVMGHRRGAQIAQRSMQVDSTWSPQLFMLTWVVMIALRKIRVRWNTAASEDQSVFFLFFAVSIRQQLLTEFGKLSPQLKQRVAGVSRNLLQVANHRVEIDLQALARPFKAACYLLLELLEPAAHFFLGFVQMFEPIFYDQC